MGIVEVSGVAFTTFQISGAAYHWCMVDFDVILGMDWLSPYHSILDNHAKVVTLAMPGLPRLEWRAFVRDVNVYTLTVESILVVKDFPGVFPADLPSIPSDRDIDFGIDFQEDHEKYLRIVLQTLREKKFMQYSQCVTEIQSSLDLAGYYRRCVEGFSSIVAPMTKLTQKGAPFIWSEECKASFQKLKSALTTTPVLVLPTAFMVGERVSLRDSPMKGVMRFGKNGKLSPMYIRPFEILKSIGEKDIKYDILKHVISCLNCQQVELSTVFHPQIDGKSKRVIQILEDMLRTYAIDFGGHWDNQLPLAEFAFYNSYQLSIQMALFEDIYARKYRSPVGWFEHGEAQLLCPDKVQNVLEKVALIRKCLRTEVDKNPLQIRARYVRDHSHKIQPKDVKLDENLTYEEGLIVILDRQVRQLRSKKVTSVKVLWRNPPIEEAT
ncbi:uncharacterized protein [Nicotiana sylvestris]|uniref:uncharacterized protein n=1 Tax=Nicotiana sylvestris TaxID=4096 RepID=UPI00388C9F80